MGSILSAIRLSGKGRKEERELGRAEGNTRKDTRLYFKPRPHRHGGREEKGEEKSRGEVKLKSGKEKYCSKLLSTETRQHAHRQKDDEGRKHR